MQPKTLLFSLPVTRHGIVSSDGFNHHTESTQTVPLKEGTMFFLIPVPGANAQTRMKDN